MPESAAIRQEAMILQTFEESLGFWTCLKSQIEGHFDGKKMRDGQNNEIEDWPRYIHKQLLNFFRQQDKQMKVRASSAQYEVYQLAQYALVGLIDDQLIRMVNWPHQDAWLNTLLESGLFDSSNAGHKLIARIDELIEMDNSGQQLSSQRKQLAYVYLCVIWLGFEGELLDNPERRDIIRAALQEISDLRSVDLRQKRLLPQAYMHERNNDKADRLAPISKWHRVIMLALIGYVVISTLLWWGLTWDLNQVLDQAFNNSGIGK